jgi:hypothetical protein
MFHELKPNLRSYNDFYTFPLPPPICPEYLSVRPPGLQPSSLTPSSMVDSPIYRVPRAARQGNTYDPDVDIPPYGTAATPEVDGVPEAQDGPTRYEYGVQQGRLSPYHFISCQPLTDRPPYASSRTCRPNPRCKSTSTTVSDASERWNPRMILKSISLIAENHELNESAKALLALHYNIRKSLSQSPMQKCLY